MIDPREQDQHVERLLREAMRGPVRAETADCLDVETLAAWSEGSLDAGARSRAESHAATCTRCQSMLAAMIRTQPAIAAPSASPFRKWLMVLVPAVSAAAAVALWFAVDPSVKNPAEPVATVARIEQAPPSKDSEEVKARANAATPASERPAGAPAPTTVPGAREADSSFADKRSAAKEVPKVLDRLEALSKPADAPASVAATPPPPPPIPPAAPPRPEQERSQVAQLQSQTQGQGQVQNQMPSPSQNQAANQAPSPYVNQSQVSQSAPAERRVIESAGRAGAASSDTRIAGARDAKQDAAANERLGYRGRQDVSGTFELLTANALIRYRVIDGRTIQRTADGGKTWTAGHAVLVPATLSIGSAPSPTVCWFAGTGGLVVRTGDGTTWREVRVPDAVDIKSITATDANTATVITANGRVFTTANGGLSWSIPK